MAQSKADKGAAVADAQKKKKAKPKDDQPWNKSTMTIQPLPKREPPTTVVDPFAPGYVPTNKNRTA